jgi:PAS domain S-box-containing protein
MVEDDKESVVELSNDMSRGIRTSNLNINRNYRKDGSIITCEWHNFALMDASGKLISVLSFVHDITEQRDAERRLRESQSRLDLALTAANQGIWDYNLKTGEITGSNRWVEILGYPMDDAASFSNTKLNDLIHPENLKLRNEELQRHLTNGTEVYKIEMRLKQKNEDWIWVRSQGKVVEWDSMRNPVRIVGTITDITEAKKLDAERERLLTELQEAFAKIKTLSGLLPICSSCKKIRDDKGYWTILEKYIMEHSDARFTHGMCPDCLKRDFPSLYNKMYGKSQ